MPAFRYSALSLDGSPRQGVIDADSPHQARSRLREEGLLPTAITVVTVLAPRRRLPRGRLAPLTRQWAALLEAGLTAEQALNALIDQAEDRASGEVLATLRAEVRGGQSLAAAMTRQSAVFSGIYRALVAAGEASGELPAVMDRLANHLEGREAAARRLWQAAAYPLILFVVAIAVMAALMTWVVPQVASVFAQSRQALPLLTRLMIGFSDFLRQWGLPLLLLLGSGLFLSVRLLRNPAHLARAQTLLMKVPLAGRLVAAADTARLAATVAILVEAGVPLLVALEAGRDVLWLAPLRHRLGAVIAHVREGMGFARALRSAGPWPPLLVHLVAGGERSGRLGTLLERAARQLQADLDHRLAVAGTLIEPLLVLSMGAAVLVLVLAMLQPVIEINLLLR